MISTRRRGPGKHLTWKLGNFPVRELVLIWPTALLLFLDFFFFRHIVVHSLYCSFCALLFSFRTVHIVQRRVRGRYHCGLLRFDRLQISHLTNPTSVFAIEDSERFPLMEVDQLGLFPPDYKSTISFLQHKMLLLNGTF